MALLLVPERIATSLLVICGPGLAPARSLEPGMTLGGAFSSILVDAMVIPIEDPVVNSEVALWKGAQR